MLLNEYSSMQGIYVYNVCNHLVAIVVPINSHGQ